MVVDRPGRLRDKVVAVTGAASGIGLASAVLFAQEGATLVLVDRDEAALVQATAMVEAAGSVALALAGDVGDVMTVDAHAEAARQRFGGFDVLLAAAGWSTGQSVADSSVDAWDAVLRTNLTGSFLWSRAAIHAMRSRGGGAIVLVGSQLAFAGGRANAAYLASKGAIVSLARSMALDHAAENIRVNVVVPGAIDTPLLARAFERSPDAAAARAASAARHPLGRLGSPDEVARAALFLASDEASFTTGSCLMVDGGWLAA
ncbi:SDR family oxidoreductase [Parvibaculum sp.]|uniref:SDR family oxidoreductase n=1 Tax=Parvibaculum sp. TaxID=2024848 RepID=UPI001D3AAA25|nr:SDR family oxidoreductase [Parvibaculum sp.]MBX3491247.1 SDR family oxidoreductase [Parvibaculum sp.]MBX3491255.1 SDR family oxidoreductase [Parvibaculum sp.]